MLTAFGGGLSRGHEGLINPRWKGEENQHMLRMVPCSQRMMSLITQQKGIGHSHTPRDWSPQPPDWEIHVLIKQPMVLDYRSSKQNIRHCSAVPSDCDLLPGPQFIWAQPEQLQWKWAWYFPALPENNLQRIHQSELKRSQCSCVIELCAFTFCGNGDLA